MRQIKIHMSLLRVFGMKVSTGLALLALALGKVVTRASILPLIAGAFAGDTLVK